MYHHIHFSLVYFFQPVFYHCPTASSYSIHKMKGFSHGVKGCGLSLDALCGSSTQVPPPHSTGVKSFYYFFFPFFKKGDRSGWCYHQHFLIYLLLKKESTHLRRDDSDSELQGQADHQTPAAPVLVGKFLHSCVFSPCKAQLPL